MEKFIYLYHQKKRRKIEFHKDDDESLSENADRVNILELDNEVSCVYLRKLHIFISHSIIFYPVLQRSSGSLSIRLILLKI